MIDRIQSRDDTFSATSVSSAEDFQNVAEQEQQVAIWGASLFQGVLGLRAVGRNLSLTLAGQQLQSAVSSIRYGEGGQPPVIQNELAQNPIMWAAHQLNAPQWPRILSTEEGASFDARVIQPTAPNGRFESVELRPGELLVVSPIQNSDRGDYAFAIFAEEDIGRAGANPRVAGIYNPDWVRA